MFITECQLHKRTTDIADGYFYQELDHPFDREENNIKLDLRKNDVVMAWRKK